MSRVRLRLARDSDAHESFAKERDGHLVHDNSGL
jgi:hypothetical protein